MSRMSDDSNSSIEGRLHTLDQLVQGQECDLFEDEDFHGSLVTRDGLLDAFSVLYEECHHENLKRNKHVAAFLKKFKSTVSEVEHLRIKASDFEVKDVIGRGHFGEVQVVRDKYTETVYALKILRKNETQTQAEISFFEEERDIMVQATSPWITKLHYAFQDSVNLYLVMEFHAGGDLLSLLARHDDIFEEKMARFYLAEIILATHDLHQMGYVHRDIKPENVLLDCRGHVKLADFGSAAKLSKDMLVCSKMPVGTPDYVSPELLTSMNSDSLTNNYGVEVDWWSVGVCMYEMLYGKTPFTDDGGSMVATYSNIMNFKKCLKFPTACAVSVEAKGLVESLLTDKEKRLEYQSIRKHRFFLTVHWDNMRQETPPFVPQLSGLDDTSNFDEFEKIKEPPSFEDNRTSRDFTGKNLPFVGFTYCKQPLERVTINRRSKCDYSQSEVSRRRSRSAEISPNKNVELKRLRDQCKMLEDSERELKSVIRRMKQSSLEDRLIEAEMEKEAYEKELEKYAKKTDLLSKDVKTLIKERDMAEKMVKEARDMTSEAQEIEDNLYKLHNEELQEVISQLEEEKASLVRKVAQKERQMDSYRDQLTASQKHVAELQKRLDKTFQERRKSRNDQKRDLALLETRDEIWRGQLEDKNTEIMDLNSRVAELEDLIEAYELQEKESMEREQLLRDRLKQRESDDLDKLDIQVVVRTSSPSPKKERKTKDKIKELESHLEVSYTEKQALVAREEEMLDTIETLKADVEEQKQRCLMKTALLNGLEKQVHQYQQEIQEQRDSCKAVKESVRQCLAENNDRSFTEKSLERKLKELEDQIESYRDDKRRLLSEVYNYQQENSDKHFKVTELERTNSRLQSKIERLERRLADSRKREIDLRLRRSETAEIRIKLAEERVKDVEEDKLKLEAKIDKLEKDLSALKDEQSDTEMKSKQSSLAAEQENVELKSKMQDLNKTIEKLERDVTRFEKNVTNLNDELSSKTAEIASLRSVKFENNRFERKIKEFEMQLKEKEEELKKEEEKSREIPKLRREKDNFETKINCLENELLDVRSKRDSLQSKQTVKLENIEDLKQEKRFLESKISSLQRQVGQSEEKICELEKKIKISSSDSDKLKRVTSELDQVKRENVLLEERLKDADLETMRKLKSQADRSRSIQLVEDKLQKEKELHAETKNKLHKELQESNLALSEARSLLSATQRQEKNTRDSLEADIRELQLRIYKLEKEKGNFEDEWNKKNSSKIRSVSELETEVRQLKAENESLAKKAKDAENKLNSQQREKSAALMEKQLLKDNLSQKEHQYELEAQKVEKLRTICGELEAQIKDLEALQSEHESQEAQWTTARQTFERAMDEREQELEGTSSRLSALNQARQQANEKIQLVKQQLQTAKTQHKTDITALQEQLTDSHKDALKTQEKLLELEAHSSKLQMVVEQQKSVLEAEREERRRIREEMSEVLTENQDLKKQNIKLRNNLESARDKFEYIFGEKVDLENFAEALQGLHFLEKYRFESTIGQQMKLIDYLQDLYAESTDKKKKGGKKVKTGTSPILLPKFGDIQTALEHEKKRNDKLQEQVDRLRSEKFQLDNEVLKLKSSQREQTAGTGKKTSKITTEVQVVIQPLPGPSGPNGPDTLLTPSVKRSTRQLALPPPTPQRMQHNIPHRFVNGLNTRATKCGVCLGSVHFVKQAAKCQECSMVCHPKCVSSAAATCGLPNEYVSHFTGMMGNLGNHLPSRGRVQAGDEDDVIKMRGWLKIPKNGKQGWERRWGVLENDILMLYTSDTDANPVDTFNLCPPETDVTVHSAVSTAELPSTAATDLPYVLRLEQEPLTTCWPGRVLYLMVTDFSAKQKWVACLEASVKTLQIGDTTSRGRMKVTSLLELNGDKRLELNCALLLSKQLTLLGCDEGLYAVNVHRDLPVVTKLNGIESVHQIKYIPHLTLIVLVTGKKRNVITIDKKLIQLRLGQSNGEETKQVPHTVIENISQCTVLDVGVWQNSAFLCVGMTDKISLMKYNPDLRLFCVRKEFSVTEPCSCVCMGEQFVLVGTDKFYQINLDHPSLAEFVDRRDTSLAFAAFGAALHNSYPLAVICVSPAGLPLEFLLCFHEFGVFVDSKGRRTRPADMKWSCLPLSFAYREPFLYVTYFNSIQAITVPASKEETRGKQTSVDLQGLRYLGAALKPGSVLVSSSTGVTTELLGVCGNDGIAIPTPFRNSNKENRRAGTKTPKQRVESPRKTSYSASSMGHKPRRLSLTSVDSNSSVSSASTVSSYGDKRSLQSDL